MHAGICHPACADPEAGPEGTAGRELGRALLNLRT